MPRLVVVMWNSVLGYKGGSVWKLRCLGLARVRGQGITLAVSHFSVSERQTQVESGLNLQKGWLLS